MHIAFDQDIQLADRLLALLKQEQQQLVDADIDAIESLIEAKSQLLQQISVAAQQRYDQLAAQGLEPSERGMGEWLKQMPDPSVHSRWQQLQEALAQARELNRVNGVLINKHFNRNREMFNQLQGNRPTNMLYGADGQAAASNYFGSSLAV